VRNFRREIFDTTVDKIWQVQTQRICFPAWSVVSPSISTLSGPTPSLSTVYMWNCTNLSFHPSSTQRTTRPITYRQGSCLFAGTWQKVKGSSLIVCDLAMEAAVFSSWLSDLPHTSRLRRIDELGGGRFDHFDISGLTLWSFRARNPRPKSLTVNCMVSRRIGYKQWANEG
jgi:hypothetical protein